MKIEKIRKELARLDEDNLNEITEYVCKLGESNCLKMVKGKYDSKDLKKDFAKLESVWSAESRLRTFATIKTLENLENIRKQLQTLNEEIKLKK